MSNLYICTKCFGLTSIGSGMQRCSCEEYLAYPGVDCPSGFHLCHMCAALLAGGTGRYSWNVCAVCLKFNRKLETNYGVKLPLGRHSIMNGLAIPLDGPEEKRDGAISQLLNSLELAEDLSEWGYSQARALFESVPTWKEETHILLSKWEAKFHLTTVRATSRSVAAFKTYLSVENF